MKDLAAQHIELSARDRTTLAKTVKAVLDTQRSNLRGLARKLQTVPRMSCTPLSVWRLCDCGFILFISPVLLFLCS